MFHSTASHFAADTNFAYPTFLLGWVTGLWTCPRPRISEIRRCIIPHPNHTFSTGTLRRSSIAVRWGLTAGRWLLVLDSVWVCWPPALRSQTSHGYRAAPGWHPGRCPPTSLQSLVQGEEIATKRCSLYYYSVSLLQEISHLQDTP